MISRVPIRCSCGKLEGRAAMSKRTASRFICYCDDCQAFAAYLDRADEILNAHGGTDVCQMSPARLELTEGVDNLACVRLTPRGVIRWYADCCKTPIGNTLPTSKIPFVGVIHSCIDLEGRSLDDVVGPVIAGVNGRFATGDRSEVDAYDKASFPVLFRVFRKILGWRLRGDHKRNPFFDETGAPVRVPVRYY